MESIEARTSLLENEKPSFFHRFLGSWVLGILGIGVSLFSSSMIPSFSLSPVRIHRSTGSLS